MAAVVLLADAAVAADVYEVAVLVLLLLPAAIHLFLFYLVFIFPEPFVLPNMSVSGC